MQILRRPVIGPGNKIVDMITGPYKLVRRCEVTAILILYGLPRYIELFSCFIDLTNEYYYTAFTIIFRFSPCYWR